jgi:hypothetical protein
MKTLHTLAAVLSAMLLILAGCQNIFEPPGASKPAINEGTFSLEIGGVSAGRTILPATVQSDFALYTLAFSASCKEDVTVDRTGATLGNTVTLGAGTWNLTVTAYLDSEKTKPAARGTLAGITISSGTNTSRSLELKASVEAGAAGAFKWNIGYPATVTSASMTITPLDTTTGTAAQTLYFTGGTPTASKNNAASPLTLNTGYYRVVFSLSDGTYNTGREEILHIYKNMTSTFAYTFTTGHFTTVQVTSGADSGPGTLRQAITDAADNGTILIDSGVGTISLESNLWINKNLTIRGNGVTITRAASWTTVDTYSQLLYVRSLFPGSGSITATISQVHFKDGRSSGYGGAIYNNEQTVNLESCVFSGNQISGAIYTNGTLTVKGCTFYGNSSNDSGGAVSVGEGSATLTGNVFYGNTAYGPVVYKGSSAVVTSGGYNVVDVDLGTGNAQSGFAAAADDKKVSALPISPVSFRLLSSSGAANVISALPADYPTVDFYGNAISNGAAAGAVQGVVSGSGFTLILSVNAAARGSVSASPQPNADGLFSGPVTVTAEPAAGYAFAYWLKDGANADTDRSLTLTMSAHTTLQAVFAIAVTNFTDTADSATTPGTLRYALNNTLYGGDVIICGVTPGSTTIELTDSITIGKDLTIQGNGVTLTRAASWTTVNNSSQLLYINGNVRVNISGIHFKDGKAAYYGAAINNYRGLVTLESCIFSGNQTTYTNNIYAGGAIYTDSGSLAVNGCTFYGNSGGIGGAVYVYSGTCTLMGNLFFSNTAAANSPVVYKRSNATVTSKGYNVVDVELGISILESGFAAATGDKKISTLPISPASFRPLTGGGAVNVITTLPAGYPTVDFYGNPISNGAAAGAVQGTATGSGYALALLVNDTAKGSVSASPPPDADGFVSGEVTVTAAPAAGYAFAYWLKDGTSVINTNPLTLTMSAHTALRAVFGRTVTVTSFTDTAGSGANGTLRYALNNAQDDDIISFSGVEPGSTTIELASALPQISKNLTIWGNGVTLTRAASWTTVSTSSQLLQLRNDNKVITVNISGVHFKDGRAEDYGGAIRNSGNILNLESCVFSGNQISGSNGSGGAIYSQQGSFAMKGCTFYGNSNTSYGSGGAVSVSGGTAILTGNLFYGNTAYRGGAVSVSGATAVLMGNLFCGNTANNSCPVVYALSSTVTSGGHNVVDAAFGTATTQCGFTAAANDALFSTLGISGAPIDATTFAPVSGLGSVLPAAPPLGFPATDFYGSPRTFPGAPGAVNLAP